jgi:hypothetical protein
VLDEFPPVLGEACRRRAVDDVMKIIVTLAGS